MARSWRLAGTIDRVYYTRSMLELSPSPLDGIEVQHRCDARMCCRDVFLDWLKMDGGSYSVNWDGMLCLLKDMKLSALARILQEALEHYHH